MQAHGGNVQCFLLKIVVQFGIGIPFSDVHTHAHRVQNKIDWAVKMFHGANKKIFEVFIAGHICTYYRGMATKLRQLINFTHAQCNGGIGQYKTCPMLAAFQRGFPSNGLIVQRTKHNSLFSG